VRRGSRRHESDAASNGSECELETDGTNRAVEFGLQRRVLAVSDSGISGCSEAARRA